MRLVVANHPSALDHDTSRNHPERPERVTAIRAGLEDSSLEIVEVVSPEISRKDLIRVHDSSYVDMIEAFCAMGGGALDMDTIVSPGSWGAALTAAGGTVAAIDELEGQSDATAFVIARPPGHHALRDRAMGFCIFNNVAIAAMKLSSEGNKVAILDWDVHHGNGTQALVMDEPSILYVSLHQAPYYPFDGKIESIAAGEAKGTIVNIPLAQGTAGDVYRRAWEILVLPVVEQFGPDWVLISAGFDAHHLDQLAGLRLVGDDYGFMTSTLRDVHPPERTVSVLEGGYDLSALRESARMTVAGFAGSFVAGEPLVSPPGAEEALQGPTTAAGDYFRL